jgi:hypothetical protein
MKYTFTLLLALAALVPFTSRAQPANLPPALVQQRAEIIALARANTLRDDNIPAIRAQLDDLIAPLAAWYNANRPANEVALTQQPWKSIWYDDPTIDEFSNSDFGGLSLRLDRDAVYQVVQNGYYFNISESTLTANGRSVRIQTYLKGAYDLINIPGPGNAGQPFLNVVDLVFVFNGLRFGPLPDNVDLVRLTRAANLRKLPVQRVPGPIGITGKLWNVYIDEELRISAGFEDDKPDELDLYLLLRAPKTGPLP